MLVELVISLTFLAVAVGALIAVFASTVLSLRRASIQGTALTLTDKQMEAYKTLPYSGLMLDASTIPSGSDPYVTANASDSTIPPSTGQVTGGSVGAAACTAPTQAQPQCATQNWTGPDGRSYRVDSYIVASTPSGGRAGKQVVVVVRLKSGSTVGPIKARATSAFDQANPPS